jgi:hypothetical protein
MGQAHSGLLKARVGAVRHTLARSAAELVDVNAPLMG